MNIKETKKVVVEFSLEDLKEILLQKAKIPEYGVSNLEQITKTEMIPGYDIHDADYVTKLIGFKIIWEG